MPALRDRYLADARAIATTWLDWERLGPVVQAYHDLIANIVQTDTRKLDASEAFEAGPDTLRAFAEARRAFVLEATD